MLGEVDLPRQDYGGQDAAPARALPLRGETSERDFVVQKPQKGWKPSGNASPAGVNPGRQIPLLPQQALPSGVTLQHALQRRRLVPRYLLLHVEDADMRGDAQAPAGDHLQQRGLPQPVPAHQPVAPSKGQVQVRSRQQDTKAREQAGTWSGCPAERERTGSLLPKRISGCAGAKQPSQTSPA